MGEKVPCKAHISLILPRLRLHERPWNQWKVHRGCPRSATMGSPLMIPRTPHKHPLRWSLLDIDDPEDFYFSCADSGCTTCCIDVDTLDEQRRPGRDAHGHHRQRKAAAQRSSS